MTRVDEILSRLELFGVRLGLDDTRRLLRALEEPHRDIRVVLISGTNGKGSTSALLASILGAAGYRVGLYSSPHLEAVLERIRVNGLCIDPEKLERLLERVVTTGGRVLGSPPTYFEALTAVAFCHFAAIGVDIAVMEVGLGGRLDATNVADPVLSLVTSISLDHQRVLGTSLGEIAREKAGILRPQGPALAWVEAEEARLALEEEARRIGAPLLDARSLARTQSEGGGTTAFRLETAVDQYQLTCSLVGSHQRRNIALAVLASEALAAQSFCRVDRSAIEQGVAACRWPGRLEQVRVSDAQEVILDGAHNEEAIAQLRLFLQAPDGQPTEAGSDGRPADGLSGPDPAVIRPSMALIFGTLDDKPAAEMLEVMAEDARYVVLTSPKSRRALDARTLRHLLPPSKVSVASDAQEGLSLALRTGCPRVVVCGSLILVGEVRQELRRRFGVPAAAANIRTGL